MVRMFGEYILYMYCTSHCLSCSAVVGPLSMYLHLSKVYVDIVWETSTLIDLLFSTFLYILLPIFFSGNYYIGNNANIVGVSVNIIVSSMLTLFLSRPTRLLTIVCWKCL